MIMLVVGALLALSLGTVAIIATQLWVIENRVDDITSFASPLNSALFAMENNVNGAGIAVMKYLDQPDAENRKRVQKNKSDFAVAKLEYDRLAMSLPISKLGGEIDMIVAEFMAAGESLMALQDELNTHFDRYSSASSQIDDILHRTVERTADPDALNAEKAAAEVGQFLSYYLHARNPAILEKVEEDKRELLAILSRPAARQAGKQWRAELKPLVDTALADVGNIVHLQESRDRGFPRFIELRTRVNDVLDTAQRLVMQRVSLRRDEANSYIDRTLGVAIVLGLATLLFGGYAIWLLIRKAIYPLHGLTEGAAILGSGNLAHRIETTGSDEYSDLAYGFNRMAAQLQNTVSELNKGKDALEERVRQRTQELARLAGHDVLTGLANRAGFQQFLDATLKGARRRQEKFALLLIDLDGFKEVNDTLGHDQGDKLLKEVATRLAHQVRETDLTARLGGDEFCLALVNVEDIGRAAEVAQRCLNALNAPLTLAGTPVKARASIGIAHYPGDADDVAGLLKAADTAMYAAKNAGKHRYACFEASMTEAVERQMALESGLREAYDHGEFELHYQPQISLRNGRMHGVEALVRWRRPQHGMVEPREFVPALERIGLINAVGVWVMETACRQAVAWQRDGMQAVVMAVNISASHFSSPAFVDTVDRIVRDTGIAPACLEIEVTESATRDPAQHATVCNALRQLGIRVSLDDFGTGYSSLAVLKKMPIDTLKLDKEFIHGLLDDPHSAVMIGAIIGLASGLNLTTVAEGVEELEQLQVLRGLDCPLAQGYYFSRAVTADLIPALARTNFLERAALGHAKQALTLVA